MTEGANVTWMLRRFWRWWLGSLDGDYGLTADDVHDQLLARVD